MCSMCDRWNDRVFPDADLSEMSIIVTVFCIFLPPANEVWGKVICLHLSVILSTSGGGGGLPGPGEGLVENPTRRLLLRAVRILLECILVEYYFQFENYLPCAHRYVFKKRLVNGSEIRYIRFFFENYYNQCLHPGTVPKLFSKTLFSIKCAPDSLHWLQSLFFLWGLSQQRIPKIID